MTDVHPAARAYDRVSPDYERGRPDYAPAAIEQLGLDAGAQVLDLGAGTGKLTRLLDAAGLETIAVDPSGAMLDELAARVPRATAVVGTAEAIPLAASSVDAVTAAQAFHWFDAPAALAEIHRVLRPGGVLGLLWNRRDESDPLQQLLAELTDPAERDTPRGWRLDVPALLEASGLFGPVETTELPHVQPTDEAGILSRLRSSSYVAGLPEGRRDELERRLREQLPVGPFALRYVTVVYVARARS
jgi:SAM-dependent methyltransferase